jgi:hypothetical protein
MDIYLEGEFLVSSSLLSFLALLVFLFLFLMFRYWKLFLGIMGFRRGSVTGETRYLNVFLAEPLL